VGLQGSSGSVKDLGGLPKASAPPPNSPSPRAGAHGRHSERRDGSCLSQRARGRALGLLLSWGVRIEEGRRIAAGYDGANEVSWAASTVPNTEPAGLPLAPRAAPRFAGALRSAVHSGRTR
jgi:hypothetical protein